MDLSRFKKNYILILIIFGSFAASIIYSFAYRIKPVVDAKAYDNIAVNIVEGFGYVETPGLPLQDDYSIARVGPLYEYFLAGIYAVFGHNYAPVWIIQAVLHALSAYFLYLTALLIFADASRKRIGLWVAGIFGFYPDLIEISAMLMMETLYIFFFVLMVYLFFKFFEKQNYKIAALLGLASGLAIFTRPPVLFLLPVIIFYFFKKVNWKKAFLLSLVFLSVIGAIFVPWTARNYKIFSRVMPFGVAGAYNFWIGNYHGGDGEQGAPPEMRQFMQTHSMLELQDESMRQFKLFLIEHPAEFLKITALRVNKYWSIARPMGFWFYQTGAPQLIFAFFSALASIFLFIFGIAGAVKGYRLKNEKFNYLLSFAILTPLILFITVVETRYRFQIYPLLAIFAGFFLANFSWKKEKVFYWTAGIIILNGVIDLLSNLDRIKEKLGG